MSHLNTLINALDHFYSPYTALSEMIRVLKKGGVLALSTDVNGTPEHPCKILENDLDEYLLTGFEIIERKCSTDVPSSWGPEIKVPVYVFQGRKK